MTFSSILIFTELHYHFVLRNTRKWPTDEGVIDVIIDRATYWDFEKVEYREKLHPVENKIKSAGEQPKRRDWTQARNDTSGSSLPPAVQNHAHALPSEITHMQETLTWKRPATATTAWHRLPKTEARTGSHRALGVRSAKRDESTARNCNASSRTETGCIIRRG